MKLDNPFKPDLNRFHVFNFQNKYLMLDIGNTCLYELSEEAYVAYNLWVEKDILPSDEILEQLNVLFLSTVVEDDTMMAEKLERDLPKQRLLWLGVTHNCNLRCSYCFVDLEQNVKQNMDFATAQKGIDKLIVDSGDQRELSIIFFGGEPLMRMNLLSEVVAYCHTKESQCNKIFRFNVTTNGMLLTPEVFQKLEELHIDVMVSLDGDQEAHDRLRKTKTGNPSWNHIIKNLERIPNFGKKIAVRITITSESPDYLKIYKTVEQLGFETIFMTEVCPGPQRSERLRENIDILKENYLKLMEYLFEKAITQGNVALSKLQRFLDALYEGHKTYYGCATGLNGYYLAPDGTYFPCNRMITSDMRFKIGDINLGFDPSIQKLFIKNHIFNRSCKECWARYLCGGQCYADSFWFTNDIADPDPFACEMIRFKIMCAAFFLSRLRECKESISSA
jgi:uncharacterized protein